MEQCHCSIQCLLYQDLTNPPQANSSWGGWVALENAPVGIVSFVAGIHAMLKIDQDGKVKKKKVSKE